jgi:hypothetical protein
MTTLMIVDDNEIMREEENTKEIPNLQVHDTNTLGSGYEKQVYL